MIVDEAIVKRVLPECYRIINELLKDNSQKQLILEAKRILPRQYSNSFQFGSGK
jgi:hypothetical protein